jgi:hypothetical protein
VTVSFTPTQTGDVPDDIYEAVAEGAMVDIPVTGTGIPGASITVTPAAGLVFPATAIGQTSAAQAITTAFQVSQSFCPPYLSPGQSCLVYIVYTAQHATDTASFTNVDLLSGTTVVTPLSGTGIAATPAKLSYSATSFNLGTDYYYGNTNVATLTITNVSASNTAVLSVSSINQTIVGFAISNNCSATLAPNASCTITIGLRPLHVGTFTGSFNVTETTTRVTQTITMSGVVAQSPNASYTLAVTPGSLSLASGQSGQALFTLTPSGGFTGSINLACAGLPVGVTCTFASPTLTADGSDTVLTSNLTVSTTGINGNARHGSMASFGILSGFLLFGFAATRKRLRKSMMPLAMLFVLAAITASMTGCGTGLSNMITPVGTSEVTVTATAAANGPNAAQTQTATFTLNITK